MEDNVTDLTGLNRTGAIGGLVGNMRHGGSGGIDFDGIEAGGPLDAPEATARGGLQSWESYSRPGHFYISDSCSRA